MSDERRVTLRCAVCKKPGGVMDFVHLKVKLLCGKCFARYSGWA
jgi:phage FluMu protein Com